MPGPAFKHSLCDLSLLVWDRPMHQAIQYSHGLAGSVDGDQSVGVFEERSAAHVEIPLTMS